MRFWVVLMGVNELDQLVELARHAEACGFHGLTYPDHLVMPTEIGSRYPYTETGEFFWPIEAPWPDPWITLSVLGAATSRIRLATNIYLAGLRDPFTVARAVSTASVFTDGRVVCGISAGWLKEEFDAAGIDFASRGRRLDEIIAVSRKLWTGEVIDHHGEFFDFEKMIMRPVPAAPVPVWSGGVSKPALRRAAANDGWLGIPMSAAENAAIVGRMQGLRREMGLPAAGFDACVSLAGPLDDAAADTLAGAGVEDMTAIPWMATPWDMARYVDEGADVTRLQVKKDAMSRFADAVIAKRGG
ncbi:TIGR03619 family F420-dependent LLM class oxidoreductase [Flavisphingomonas formosensis]|uniref:TIGR03619 family F420-dependent LLM class oxidoreductase n=1 Tax=Flavisphingomonas formosensis TaxID=861534 RepID=UPI0012FA08C3|nr:TIGR03619 family F420-dependent LLM class oxidoreductase [Sphingomonas formosensis]